VEIRYEEALDQDATRQRVLEHLESMKRRSTEAGMAVVEKVATAAEALIAMQAPSVDSEREVMETVCRGLDLMTLLVHDHGRRKQGYPPAALHEAVHVLLEQMDRIKVRIH
jgi:hypothetical protein